MPQVVKTFYPQKGLQVDRGELDTLADLLSPYFANATEFAQFKQRAVTHSALFSASDGNGFSLSTAIRGLCAQQGRVINQQTKAADLAFVEKALTTGDTPGSYLVPTAQAGEIISALMVGGVARLSGARIWPLGNLKKLTVPTATTAPTVEYLGENTAQTATDAAFGQVSFDLKTCRALTVIPNELLRFSAPGIDNVLATLMADAVREFEDQRFFAIAAASNGPTPFYATASVTTVNADSGNANGGSLLYSDLLAVLKLSAAAKTKGPYAWYCSPRTFYTRILGLLDLQSRPLVVQDSQGPLGYRLFGSPLYVTAAVPENIAIGSGTNLSYIMYTNPRYLHIAQSTNIELAVSSDLHFAENQTTLRVVLYHDFAAAPPAGVVILKGVA